MEILTYKEIPENLEIDRFLQKKFTLDFFEKLIIENTGNTYLNLSKKNEWAVKHLANDYINRIRKILSVTGLDLDGKVFLDLGCGSLEGTVESDRKKGFYEPWICRSLLGLDVGGRIIGVDVGDLSSENFEYYRRDLLYSNALDFLEDNSIHFAHGSLLFTSPELEKRINGNGNVADASISSEIKLKGSLFPQLERVLVPEGCFLCSEFMSDY